MNTRGIKVSIGLIIILHRELLSVFSKHYSLEIKTLTVFQLYGFGNYEEELPNLKGFIAEVTGQWINGKYIYNKIREIEKGNNKSINLKRDYLSLLIISTGYENYSEYLKKSPYITKNIRELEGTNLNETPNNVDTLYYIGYYVEDRQYYINIDII